MLRFKYSCTAACKLRLQATPESTSDEYALNLHLLVRDIRRTSATHPIRRSSLLRFRGTYLHTSGMWVVVVFDDKWRLRHYLT